MQPEVDNLLRTLSESLRERVRVVQQRLAISSTTTNFGLDGAAADAEFILYWMHSALRADENPALEVAIHFANQLRLPVLVYQGLSQRYRYASDRHHTFILEGARDVALALQRRGLAYALHVERPSADAPTANKPTTNEPVLKQLAQRAAVVVTEDMPVSPQSIWMAALSRQTSAPLLAVDTACVVPMQLVGKAFDRAFAYRDATAKLRSARVAQQVPSIAAEITPFQGQLPFKPIDLSQTEISALVAQCAIDHSVGPVPHTRGGSIAGYARWEKFKNSRGLARYDRLRNNPLVEGTSRLSAYLHYGMISPMRIAREALQSGGSGAEKFLDELLIWRELAYTFCFYRPDHARRSAIPNWAHRTLEQHAGDEREATYSWEILARGRTGETLWDAAQQSLLIHGELHNSARMTWGKAILNWTSGAKQALAMLIDLNHRYALDGRDPASYGGILWCLGQFDRPFEPEQPMIGTVRPRPTNEHARRLDVAAYHKVTTRSLYTPVPKVAVIGAGLSGLICARTLADHGLAVTVFEKSRGVGGRMATRRTPNALQFDHGAQYFTARNATFRRYVKSWQQSGIVQLWDGKFVRIEAAASGERHFTDAIRSERFVAVPGMNALGKHLADGLNVQFDIRVLPPQRTVPADMPPSWQLVSDTGADLGVFDAVVISAPAKQTVDLLADAPELAARASLAQMQACWAIMIATESPLAADFAGAFVTQSPLAWIARNTTKLGRPQQPESWVLHASAAWSEEHVDTPKDVVETELIEEFWRVVGLPPQPLAFQSSHLWRYSIPTRPLSDGCLFDAELNVAACGDWCMAPRVEGAFLSGLAAAGRILGLAANKFSAPLATSSVKQLELF